MLDNTTLARAQADLAARLASDEYFVDIPVITDRQGDIDATVAKALGTLSGKGGKRGICALVLQPVGTDVSKSLPVPVMELDLVVRVMENVVVNGSSSGTGKDAASVARRIVDVLSGYRAQGIVDMLRPREKTIVPVPAERLVAYEVQFVAREDRRQPVEYRCAEVAMAVTGASLPYSIALSCPTTGASIYYTLDGTYPGSSNTAAHLYSTAVSVTTAATVRAAAHKTGLLPSNAVSRSLA